jgi:hypothetical protein
MLGLVNRSIQNFLTDTFGIEIWYAVACKAEVSPDGFEPMLSYEDALTDRLLEAACETLDRRCFDFLEDLGTYLSTREAVRRLLRYGGRDYVGFLRSLNELRGRTQLALEDLKLPELTLHALGEGQYTLGVSGASPGWGAVFAGVLRAMADDYGALALIELQEEAAESPQGEAISVQLLDSFHARGRSFDLADAAGVET